MILYISKMKELCNFVTYLNGNLVLHVYCRFIVPFSFRFLSQLSGIETSTQSYLQFQHLQYKSWPQIVTSFEFNRNVVTERVRSTHLGFATSIISRNNEFRAHRSQRNAEGRGSRSNKKKKTGIKIASLLFIVSRARRRKKNSGEQKYTLL